MKTRTESDRREAHLAEVPSLSAASIGTQTTSQRSNWTDAWKATSIGIIFPEKAARRVLAVPGSALRLALLAWSLFLGFIILLAAALVSTRSLDIVFEVPSAQSGYAGDKYNITRKPLANAIDEMKTGPLGGAIVLIPLLTLLLATCVVLIVSALYLPSVHSKGPLSSSYGKSCRAVTVTIGALTVFMGSATLLAVRGEHMEWEEIAAHERWNPWTQPISWQAQLLQAAPYAAFSLWAIWAARAARGTRAVLGNGPVEPQCEGCGYSLVRHTCGERCPECGLPTIQSITEEIARPGISWQHHPTPLNWIPATFYVIFRPRDFFRRLLVNRGHDLAFVYLILHLALIALATSSLTTWVTSALQARLYTGKYAWLLLLEEIIATAFALGLFLWIAYHFIVLVVMICAVKGSFILDGRRVGVVGDYQAALLWVTVPILVICVSSFSGSANAPFEIRSVRLWVPLPGMWYSAWAIPVALVVWLLHRYRLALRAVRWANF